MNIKSITNNYMSLTIVIALLYFITGKISFFFSLENSIVTLCIFFAEGISLASVILFGRKAILGVFIGQFLLALNSDLSFLSSFGVAIINALELLIAFNIFTRYNFDKQMLTIRDLKILFLTIIFVLQPFSSFFGNIVLLSSSALDLSSFLWSLFSWWFGNTMGQMLIVPMILAIYQYREQARVLKILLIVLTFVILNYSLIILLDIHNIALLFSFMIPLVLLVSRRNGLYYAGISVFVIAVTSLYTSKLGIGIFASESITDNLININFYILAHIIILYTHGISISEKEIVANKLKDLNISLKDTVDSEVQKNMKKDRLMMQQFRLAQVGEAISMIAHQWKQPLNTLSLITEGMYIKYTMGKLNLENMKNFREQTQRQIKQMSSTIDDFSEFFKPEKEKETFLIVEPIKHALTILEPILKKESIQIEKNIEKELHIVGYPNELAQVVINIINNAKDALVDKSDNQEKIIKINLFSKEAKVYISIEDNAAGIPSNIIEKIFDPYFSTKIEKNGTGLGLYMSKTIIEEHMQGSLSVKNTINGAKFILAFEKK